MDRGGDSGHRVLRGFGSGGVGGAGVRVGGVEDDFVDRVASGGADLFEDGWIEGEAEVERDEGDGAAAVGEREHAGFERVVGGLGVAESVAGHGDAVGRIEVGFGDAGAEFGGGGEGREDSEEEDRAPAHGGKIAASNHVRRIGSHLIQHSLTRKRRCTSAEIGHPVLDVERRAQYACPRLSIPFRRTLATCLRGGETSLLCRSVA